MNLWLAPLHGITNYQFRNTLCRHFAGIDFIITPFLPVQEKAKLNVKNWKDIWPKNNTLHPTIPQLMGNQPAHFVDTMNVLHDTYGYESFNWNIGCPVSQVVHRKRVCRQGGGGRENRLCADVVPILAKNAAGPASSRRGLANP